MTSTKKIVGKNIKFLLNNRNLSQADLYRSIGSNSGSVSEWINGKKMPEIESLEKIADFFSVPISELFIDRFSFVNEDENTAALSYYRFLQNHPDAKTIADCMMGFSNEELRFLSVAAKNIPRLRNNAKGD